MCVCVCTRALLFYSIELNVFSVFVYMCMCVCTRALLFYSIELNVFSVFVYVCMCVWVGVLLYCFAYAFVYMMLSSFTS